MNPFYEPNEFELAESYLAKFKEIHVVSEENEIKLIKLLNDYFWHQANGSPASRSEAWIKVKDILMLCMPKN